MKNQLNQKEIQHLFWRAGFGINYSKIPELVNQTKENVVDALFNSSKLQTPLSFDFRPLKKASTKKTKLEKKQFRKLKIRTLFELNKKWYDQMIHTDQILRERMTLFFHDHFAVNLRQPFHAMNLNNILRNHALGSFELMLMEVSKSPAMLLFLNNRQNRKDSPNENFAREVMELFTLGRDNGYTEKDIKEAARAFTGWNFKKDGEFVFRKNQHDSGEKVFLGRKGNFKGEDIIGILLEEKQTSRYLCEKIYKYFVNPKVNDTHVNDLAEIFYESKYNLKTLMKTIFMSEWFYEDQNIGAKIKSPTELIVGLGRQFDVKFQNHQKLILLQKKLNQTLFLPPNVAGWPGGKYWIDSSTLMIRLKLPSLMLTAGELEWDEKEDMPENMVTNKKSKRRNKQKKQLQTTSKFDQVAKKLSTLTSSELIDFLVQTKPLNYIENSLLGDNKTDKELIIKVLSLPEYQLC